jgi:hypothetical protein
LSLALLGKDQILDIKKTQLYSEKSHWLGVKAHYKLDFQEDYVGLHHFKGGYCGVSKMKII